MCAIVDFDLRLRYCTAVDSGRVVKCSLLLPIRMSEDAPSSFQTKIIFDLQQLTLPKTGPPKSDRSSRTSQHEAQRLMTPSDRCMLEVCLLVWKTSFHSARFSWKWVTSPGGKVRGECLQLSELAFYSLLRLQAERDGNFVRTMKLAMNERIYSITPDISQ